MAISKMLFGEIALRKGLVTQAQIDECLDIQKKLKDMGITKTLGAVMHDKKYLSMVEIKEILREMTGTKDWNAIEGYQILEKLGKGGMGSVYKALHTGLNKLVALKVLPPELASDQEYLDRFWREARAAAKLNHPNIVQALDVGESFGYHYFVMEYVDGLTVKEMIDKEVRVPEGKALHVIAQVTEALVHAYKAEMVHRDIKPSNIIMTKRGIAKLCDLGLAKSLQEDSAITQTGVIMGTPFYLSPEQARNEDLDWRSDIYSLGVTVFHMLTGQVPFTGNTAATILYKHIFMEPPGVRSLNADLSPETERLVLRMMAKAPADRQANAIELLEEVCKVLKVVSPELVGPDGRLVPPPQDVEPEPPPPSLAVAVAAARRGDAGLAARSPATVEEEREAQSGNYVEVDDMPSQTGQVSRTGALTMAEASAPDAGISGPQARISVGSSDTHGSVGSTMGSTTGGMTGGVTAPFEILRPHATVRSRGRPVLVVASLVGLLVVGAVVVREVSALLDAPPAKVNADMAHLFSKHLRPSALERLAAAERHRSKGAYGEAARELARLRVMALSASEEARALALTERVLADAVATAERLHSRYLELARAGKVGLEVTRTLEQLEALGLKAVAELAENEEARLRALAVHAKTMPPGQP